MPNSTTSKTPVQLRIPNDLHGRVKTYSEDRKISLSDALRRLLHTGLRADIDDQTDISHALAKVRSDVHDHTGDLLEIHAALEDVKGTLAQQQEVLQGVSAFTERVAAHGEPVLKMLCELLLISRCELDARSTEAYETLVDAFPQQYEFMKASVLAQAAQRDATQRPPPARQRSFRKPR